MARADERGGRLLRRDDESPLSVDKGPGGLGRICDSWDVEAQQKEPLQSPGVGVGGTGWVQLVTDIRTDKLGRGPAELEVHVERVSRLIEVRVSSSGQRKGLGSLSFSCNSLRPKHSCSLVPVGREGAEAGICQRGSAKAQ